MWDLFTNTLQIGYKEKLSDKEKKEGREFFLFDLLNFFLRKKTN